MMHDIQIQLQDIPYDLPTYLSMIEHWLSNLSDSEILAWSTTKQAEEYEIYLSWFTS